MDKKELLLNYISHLFSEIRGDWSDPRRECREGWEAIARLQELLGYSPRPGYRHHQTAETDEQYFDRLKDVLA